MARSSIPDAVYRALLRLYPARFQEEFAADMALDFADASDEGWMQRGWCGLMAVWVGTSRDLVRSRQCGRARGACTPPAQHGPATGGLQCKLGKFPTAPRSPGSS